MSLIKIENLSYIYGAGTPFRMDAITDINLEIDEGQFIGVIGHTGSGKSTLVMHLNGLMKPSKGKIFVDAKDIWEEPKKIRDIRFKVGLVFQYPEYQLFEETVFKDIAFGPSNMALSEAEVEERVREAAQIVGVSDEMLKKSPFDLSGGEKRRVAIAGVLAMRPKVLVLDEPTAGLDPSGRELILSRVSEYQKRTGATVLLVSHNMEDVAKIADKVLVLNKGRVAMFDETEKVFSRGTELKEMGLNVPQITDIFASLRQRGYDLPNSVFTMEQGVAALRELLSKGGNANA